MTSLAPNSGPEGVHDEKAASLRHRKAHATSALIAQSDGSLPEPEISKNEKDNKEDVTWGKTPSGVVFRVPQTHSFLHTMLTTLHRSSLTRLTFLTLISQPVIFYLLSTRPFLRSAFFLIYFAFWRGAYDWGFAYLLRRQSEKKWIVRSLKRWGWLDTKSEQGGEEGREWAKWWKRELEMKMGDGYKWENVPQEFNSWLIFRQLVDLVLLNDFVSYTCFAWSNLHFPENHSTIMHVFRWAFGWSLIAFNLWVKMDAHRVVKDYAWYWGDAFWLMVMQHDLVFDGVYEIAPHPMYSVGYAGYYGLSMVVGSYTVLFTSLAAHAAQFAFLLWFENPHIERIYGGAKKPLASRVPLSFGERSEVTSSAASVADATPSIPEEPELATPGATEGETETEPELPELPQIPNSNATVRTRSDSTFSATSFSISPSEPTSMTKPKSRSFSKRAKSVSMHDLTHRFFRKPVIVLDRVDIFRSTDFALITLLGYSVSTLVPALPTGLALTAHFLHALAWRVFHSYGLGLLLRAQSKSKWLVRHYLKHYHYPGEVGDADDKDRESVVKRATEEAFGNWQVGYNISLVMTYVSFANLAWKTYNLPSDWTVSGTMLRHVLGFALIALHIWAATSSYEVLGDFGWLYSDFFLIEQVPSQLAYTGIYRFLNNPERSMGGAAFFGLWLISNSKLVLTLAIFSHLSHWWFLSFVEQPHMKSLYGDRLRKDGGLTKTLKSVAGKTFADQGGRHSDIKRVVQEVKGSIEKVEDKLTEAVGEFLDHARPMFSDAVNETKFLLQQTRERMIITRVAHDISAYDPSRYSITLPTTSSAPAAKYQVGQPIRVSWTAPSNHSRKDWIGIYRLGSCKSQLVTRISSVGKWMPIHEDEWDGNDYIDPQGDVRQIDAGEVVFRGDQLPWTPGKYELRYHHDGKHNVLSRVAPIEIFVHKPADASFQAAHETLLNIVSLSLDSDKALLPRSARSLPSLARMCAENARPAKGQTAKNTKVDEGDSDPSTPVAASPLQRESQLAPPSNHGSDLEVPGLDSLELEHEFGNGEVDIDHDDGRDPDDFSIMSETQAKRIVALIEMAFDVEISPDVVLADANVGLLTKRVLGARSLTAPKGVYGGGAGAKGECVEVKV